MVPPIIYDDLNVQNLAQQPHEQWKQRVGHIWLSTFPRFGKELYLLNLSERTFLKADFDIPNE